MRLLALTPSSEAADIGQLSLEPGEPVAVLLGAEGPGLSSGTLAAADQRVRIPMSGTVDSINVGSAAAIAFYAVSRARARAGPEAGERSCDHRDG
jgi:tRNA G18 (ribose-2'-O)-methylase SpoU